MHNIKKRFLDNINKSKILGVHSINDEPFNKNKAEFHKKLKNEIKKHDIVIVSDMGTGLIQEDSIKIILKKFKIFSSKLHKLIRANIGYHTISKYKGADLIIINENEMTPMSLGLKLMVVDLLIKLSQRLKSKFITVTSEKKGVKIFEFFKQEILICPAFAN